MKKRLASDGNAAGVAKRPRASNGSSLASNVVSSSQSTLDEGQAQPMATWSIQAVASWLNRAGFSNAICRKFMKQRIDGEVLSSINNEQLKKELRVTALGDRVKLLNRRDQLLSPVADESGASR